MLLDQERQLGDFEEDDVGVEEEKVYPACSEQAKSDFLFEPRHDAVLLVLSVPPVVHQTVERVPVRVLQTVKQFLFLALSRRFGIRSDENVTIHEALLILDALRRKLGDFVVIRISDRGEECIRRRARRRRRRSLVRERVQLLIERAVSRRDLVFASIVEIGRDIGNGVWVICRHGRQTRETTAARRPLVQGPTERRDVLVLVRRARALVPRFVRSIATLTDDRRGDEERARQADRERRLQARASTLVLRAIRRGRRRRRVGVDEGYGLLVDALHLALVPRCHARSRAAL